MRFSAACHKRWPHLGHTKVSDDKLQKAVSCWSKGQGIMGDYSLEDWLYSKDRVHFAKGMLLKQSWGDSVMNLMGILVFSLVFFQLYMLGLVRLVLFHSFTISDSYLLLHFQGRKLDHSPHPVTFSLRLLYYDNMWIHLNVWTDILVYAQLTQNL